MKYHSYLSLLYLLGYGSEILIDMFLPSSSSPSACEATWASLSDWKVTNANPLDLPVSISLMSLIYSTSPNCMKKSSSYQSSTLQLRFPTNKVCLDLSYPLGFLSCLTERATWTACPLISHSAPISARHFSAASGDSRATQYLLLSLSVL